MAPGTSDRFRIVCAVYADPGLVQAHPKDADGIVRPWRDIVEIVCPHPMVEHAFIVAEPGQGRYSEDFPDALRSRQRFRSWRDWKLCYQAITLPDLEKIFAGVDVNLPRREDRIRRNKFFRQLFDLERLNVRHFHCVAGL